MTENITNRWYLEEASQAWLIEKHGHQPKPKESEPDALVNLIQIQGYSQLRRVRQCCH